MTERRIREKSCESFGHERSLPEGEEWKGSLIEASLL